MFRWRKAVALLLVPTAFSAVPAAASEPEMASIETFVAQNPNSRNGVVEVFVGLRCSSLFSLFAAFSRDNNVGGAEKWDNGGKTALYFAMEKQNPKNSEYIENQMKMMIDGYKDRWLKAKALTGNFSDDPVIKGDTDFCISIFGNQK